MIAAVCFGFTFGALGDLFGRNRLISAGAGLVAVGSTVAALAPTVQTLWAGAALNGLGAGATFPGSLTMLASSRERAHAAPLVTAVGMIGVRPRRAEEDEPQLLPAGGPTKPRSLPRGRGSTASAPQGPPRGYAPQPGSARNRAAPESSPAGR